MDALTFEIQPLAKVCASGLGAGAGLAAQIYDLLRRRIIDLSLPPEMPLAEQDVANLLQASKTPVREAMIRLSREGLVAVVPKSGSYVTPINIERYLQACFVRVQLEVGCVRRLASLPLGLEDVTHAFVRFWPNKKRPCKTRTTPGFLLWMRNFTTACFKWPDCPAFGKRSTRQG